MMGLMNTFTTSMKYFPSGCMATPDAGKKCPSNAPELIAINTQKVRLVTSFFTAVILNALKISFAWMFSYPTFER